MSKTTIESQVSQAAAAMGAYCKVMALGMQVTREGVPMPANLVSVMDEALEGLVREVKFLRFLREKVDAGD
jgi:hypothetical protein